MADAMLIFHLAIPCRDLDEAERFYVDRLGCRLARRYDDRITFEFFGHQVVCHLAPDAIDPAPKMYPRHFGVTFRRRTDFEVAVERARANGARFFAEPSTRFAGRPEAHSTAFLQDPSNNLIELKHYPNAEMMY